MAASPSVLLTRPSGPLLGTLSVPGDKSITHRAIILSALAEGESTISSYCRGADCLHTARAFQALGVPVEVNEDQLRITGKGLDGLREPAQIVDCGNSGTAIRLLCGVLAGQSFFSVLTGDESIRRRPMARIVRPLRQMGATIAGRQGGDLAPLAITGARLHGITYESPIASAQVKSAVLLAGLFADGATTVTEPSTSRDHTERMFTYLGISLSREGARITVRGQSGYKARDMVVPGDISAAAFFLVAATIVPSSDVTILGVGINPTRTGVLTSLQEMGAHIELLNAREQGGEPVADLRVRHAPIRGIHIGAARISETIDELPVLCLAAACAKGETVISGAAELRVKESDRIATMATELGRLGVEVEERPDGLRIIGGRPLRAARCHSYGDHRVAMTMAIAGLVAEGETQVEDADCIDTSFPDFDKYLRRLLTPKRQG
jgi:3-phosphoshikimate 1-carboxyvinyltransferase